MKIQYDSVPIQLNEVLDKMFQKQNAFISVNPGNIILPRNYPDIGEAILDLKVRKDDIWMISYPRTGSTWAQEMVWLLGNDLDYESAKQIQITRSPLLELSTIFSEDHSDWLKNSVGNSVNLVEKLSSPRYIKTHLPLHLLPVQLTEVKPKIIYTCRNPKDLCVSYYYYCKLVHDLQSSFEDFCELFLNGHTPIGDYASHILSFWKMRNDSNLLFLKYEDMKEDLPSIIVKCAEFLNLENKLSDNQIQGMCDYLKFDQMQKNPAVNLEPIIGKQEETPVKFIRKGQIGDWKNYMNDEVSAKFDEWIHEKFANTGLIFKYE